jgi:hypothetical protein
MGQPKEKPTEDRIERPNAATMTGKATVDLIKETQVVWIKYTSRVERYTHDT